MAYEFLGTFNAAMYGRLKTFVQSQKVFIEDRINHLSAEIDRIGQITFKYDNGVPIGYVADSDSYLGKLLAAYEVLGGNPVVDLRVRLIIDPVYLLTGSEEAPPGMMSNGEVVGAKGLNDADSGDLIRPYREGFNSTIYRRFDYLERKIRRAVDYADQLQAEVSQLTLLLGGPDVEGTLENLQSQIEQVIKDPTFRAVTPDESEHAELGRDIYAPFSSYDVPEGSPQDPSVVVHREANTTQRQSGDISPVKPGQTSA